MIQVIPLYNEKYNCIENILGSIAAYWGCDCSMMSSEVWGFSYKSIQSLTDSTLRIGDKIHSNSGDFFKLFEQYHDVKINIHDLSSYTVGDLKNIIANEIHEEHPVILMIDLFRCPWTKFYEVYHAIHYCLILGINEEHHSLYCIDPLYTVDVIELPVANFEQGCMSCITLQHVQKESHIDWRFVIKNASLHYLGGENSQRAYDDMCLFAKEMKEQYHAADEFTEVNGQKISKLSNQINYIRLARLSFSYFLEEFAKKYNINALYEFSDRMNKISNIWYNINIMFIKSSYLEENERFKNRIANTVLELAKQERDMAHALIELTEQELETLEHGKSSKKLEAQLHTENREQQEKELQDDVKAKVAIENMLVNIWKEVLKRESVDTHDNFFKLGGDSVTLVMMHNQIDDWYPGKIDVTDMFAYPTIDKLAEFILHVIRKKVNENSVIKLLELPKPFFEGVKEERHVFFSNIEANVGKQLKRISDKYKIHISSIFLAGYMYLVNDITKHEVISVSYINEADQMKSIQLNLEEIENITNLIKIVDERIQSERIILNPIMEHEDFSNEAWIVFCENNGVYEMPNYKHKLVVTASEVFEEYHLKVELENLNKEKVKEIFTTYIRIICYIAQNV